jgi:hypothetical protein
MCGREVFFVVVLDSVGTSTGSAITQRLEGSRFGMCPAALATSASSLVPPQGVITSGSRERPQRYAFTRGL